MRFAGPHLLFFTVAGTLAAQPAEPTPPAKNSARMAQEIRTTLPKFAPPPETKPTVTESAPATPDPELLVLPKVTVQERRLPPDAADHLMSRDDFKRKMENLYLDELAKDGPLNVLLNNFSIPFLTPSRAARGHAIYREREMDRLREIGAKHDAAKQIDRELDNSHTTRPAGGLEKK